MNGFFCRFDNCQEEEQNKLLPWREAMRGKDIICSMLLTWLTKLQAAMLPKPSSQGMPMGSPMYSTAESTVSDVNAGHQWKKGTFKNMLPQGQRSGQFSQPDQPHHPLPPPNYVYLRSQCQEENMEVEKCLRTLHDSSGNLTGAGDAGDGKGNPSAEQLSSEACRLLEAIPTVCFSKVTTAACRAEALETQRKMLAEIRKHMNKDGSDNDYCSGAADTASCLARLAYNVAVVWAWQRRTAALA